MKFIHMLAAAAVCVIAASASPTGASGPVEILPQEPVWLPTTADVLATCTLKNHNDTIKSYFSNITAGERYATFLDPAACGLSPAYPFELRRIGLTLMSVVGAVWPVSVDFEVYSRTAGGTCAGPGTLVCSQRVLLDSATFALPHVGEVTLASPCTLNGPFYLSISYNGTTASHYPSPIFDTDMPGDSCLNWGYWSTSWYRWNHFWTPPIPGNIIVWGIGGPIASGDTVGCCVGLSGNVDSDPAQIVDISDLSVLVEYLFGGAAVLACSEEADIDQSGAVDISDLTALVTYLFFGGLAPAGCL
jgi:hypothetical protein